MFSRAAAFFACVAVALSAPGNDASPDAVAAPALPPAAPAAPAGPADPTDLESPPYDMSVVDSIECEDVPAWDESVLGGSADSAGLASADLKVQTVRDGAWLSGAGFERYALVFGVPVVVSNNIGAVTLGRAARGLASLLDNDGNGEADNPAWVEGLIRYRVVFGFFASGAESEAFWRNTDKRPSYKGFMEQYLCNMHFVEIWQADLSPLYYTSMAQRDGLIESGTLDALSPNILKRCGTATTDNFDLSMWYYLFSVYYYGIVDHLTPETALAAESAMRFIRDGRGFNPHYAADPEMTLADFLAWATLTKMGALECHCTQTAIQNHWRPCRTADLPEPLVKLLDNIDGIPSRIPNPNYPKPRGIAEPPTEAAPPADAPAPPAQEGPVEEKDAKADRALQADETAQEAVEETAEKPVEETAEEPAEETAEEPAEEPLEESLEESEEESEEESLEESEEESVEESVEESTEELEEEVAEQVAPEESPQA